MSVVALLREATVIITVLATACGRFEEGAPNEVPGVDGGPPGAEADASEPAELDGGRPGDAATNAGALDAGSGYANLVLSDSPVAYWRLDEGAQDRNAFSLVSVGHTLTAAGSIGRGVAGAIASDANSASSFGGGFFLHTSVDALAFAGAFSLEAWIFPESPDTTPAAIFVKTGDAADQRVNGYGLWFSLGEATSGKGLSSSVSSTARASALPPRAAASHRSRGTTSSRRTIERTCASI